MAHQNQGGSSQTDISRKFRMLVLVLILVLVLVLILVLVLVLMLILQTGIVGGNENEICR